MKRHAARAVLLLVAWFALPAGVFAQGDIPAPEGTPPGGEDPAAAGTPPSAGDPGPTPFEVSGGLISPTWEETIDYLRQAAACCSHIELSSFGYSTEGRPLPIVLVGDRDGVQAPDAHPKPVVLINAGIHAGEICGNDAVQLLLRDIARGLEPEIVAHCDLIIVPILNVDGHVRRDPYNRFTQNGPADGFGTRRNAMRLDLNRDFTKLETPECQALVRLGAQFQPHVFIDLHTNDGFDHQYDLLFGGYPDPTLPGGRDRLVREALFPWIVEAMTAEGFRGHPIGSPVDELDLTAGLATYGSSPHLATGYFETRSAISILSEAHPYISYERRVRSTLALLRAILRFAARNRIELIESVDEARETALRWSFQPGQHEVALGCRADPQVSRTILWLGKALQVVRSPITGRDYARYEDTPVTYELPFFDRLIPQETVTMPRGYLIEKAWGEIAATLRRHAIQVQVLTQPFTGWVETHYATHASFSGEPKQGHHPITDVDFVLTTEQRVFPAGTYWIPCDQPTGITAMHLLEPRAPAGLLVWNAFDSIFERGIIVEDWALEEQALALLADPEIRAEYEDALQDSAFAADPQSRLEFFFQKTPYVQEDENRYPVYRLMQAQGPRGN
ncbi:MAG: M14 family zinc carboxypeptidase [Candidatus Eisenbacteria bacterium]